MFVERFLMVAALFCEFSSAPGDGVFVVLIKVFAVYRMLGFHSLTGEG